MGAVSRRLLWAAACLAALCVLAVEPQTSGSPAPTQGAETPGTISTPTPTPTPAPTPTTTATTIAPPTPTPTNHSQHGPTTVAPGRLGAPGRSPADAHEQALARLPALSPAGRSRLPGPGRPHSGNMAARPGRESRRGRRARKWGPRAAPAVPASPQVAWVVAAGAGPLPSAPSSGRDAAAREAPAGARSPLPEVAARPAARRGAQGGVSRGVGWLRSGSKCPRAPGLSPPGGATGSASGSGPGTGKEAELRLEGSRES